MNGFTDKCKDCRFFSWRDYVPERERIGYATRDGHCSKVFPRGYSGKGREGGPVRRMQAACFQFEEGEDKL